MDPAAYLETHRNLVQACCAGGFTTLQDWVSWKPGRQHLCTTSVIHVCKVECYLQVNCAKTRQNMLQVVTKASPVTLQEHMCIAAA